MKITLTPTQEADVSSLGAGHVWEGKTEKGTPVRALICGLMPSSDDPKMIERFVREYTEVPEVDLAVCPDCGQPLSSHRPTRTVGVDPYQVIARFVIGADMGLAEGDEEPEDDPNRLAEIYREQLADHNRAHHDRMLRAAHMVLEYVEDIVNAQTTPMHKQVAGNA